MYSKLLLPQKFAKFPLTDVWLAAVAELYKRSGNCVFLQSDAFLPRTFDYVNPAFVHKFRQNSAFSVFISFSFTAFETSAALCRKSRKSKSKSAFAYAYPRTPNRIVAFRYPIVAESTVTSQESMQ
jgi:hypothetical protein